MPNWCDTTYKCVFNNKSDFQDFKKILKKTLNRRTSRVQNGFGVDWIGNIIDALGFDWQKYKCRGEIYSFDYDRKAQIVTIYMSTAWCEQEGFRFAIEEKYDAKVYFQDMECGCDNFTTNSFEYFPERYYLDNYNEPLYFDTIEDLQSTVSGIVGYEVEADFDKLEEALDKLYEEHNEDDEYWNSPHEFSLIQ